VFVALKEGPEPGSLLASFFATVRPGANSKKVGGGPKVVAAKASAGGKGNRGLSGAMSPNARPAKKAKIISVAPPGQQDVSATRHRSADALEESDTIWLAEQSAKLSDVSCQDVANGEDRFKLEMQEKEKLVNTFLTEVKVKARSMTRRANAPANEIGEQINDLQVFLTKLQKLMKMVTFVAFSGDESLELLKDLEDKHGAQFGKAITNRVLKMLCLDDLKYCRWSSLATATYDLVVMYIKPQRDAELFYAIQLAQVLQKLLRAINQTKVT
jgi:hypothetical protein